MSPQQRETAELCLRGAESGTIDFPAILGKLIGAGFDGYLVDLRTGSSRYALADGESLDLAHRHPAAPVAEPFDAPALLAAIREAQAKAPGYSYPGFCDKASAAGCAGYLVSLPGRRVLYFGRTGETLVEHFPGSA